MRWPKKTAIFAMLVMLSALELNAQTYKYQTYNFAFATKDRYGLWSDWSDWKSSDMLVVFNGDKDRITIYSERIQEYDIYESEGRERDEYGGTTAAFMCVDDNGLRCRIRIREQADGSLQLYVDYNDMMWVYGIRRR